MSPVPTGLSGGKGTEKRRRLSFFDSPKKMPPTEGECFGVSLFLTQVHGIPASWLKQYRIVVKCDHQKSPTSWKASGKAVFPVGESAVLVNVSKSATLTLTVERRNMLGKPTVIGESTSFSISELENKQNAHYPDPFTLDLTPLGESQLMFLDLSFRIFNSVKASLPNTDSMARSVFGTYPGMVVDALKAWDEFSPVLSDPLKQASHRFLSEVLYQMGKYIRDHPRQELSYDIEDRVWEFLRETVQCIKTYKPPPGGSSQAGKQFSCLANHVFRGFWLLSQLHRPQMFGFGDQQQRFIRQELHVIAKSFARPPHSRPIETVSMFVQYPQLLKLKAVDTPPPRPQGPGIESLFHNTTFKQIARWIVSQEAEYHVFWLHGKFDSGTARSQIGAALMEASRVIGFPAAYYSLSLGATQTIEHKVQDMLDSLIYQLSRHDLSLAGAFHAMITGSNEAFASLDFYARFQLLLHTLLSLSFAEQAKSFPILLIIDDLEPSDDSAPSSEYNQILQILHTASVATNVTTPVSSLSSDTHSPLDFSSSSFARPHRDSLPFPPFLRIVVISRSLGNNPSLIAEFASIQNGHRLSGTRSPNDQATKLYNIAVNGPSKGKVTRERIPLDYGPLITIAEANSQTSNI